MGSGHRLGSLLERAHWDDERVALGVHEKTPRTEIRKWRRSGGGGSGNLGPKHRCKVFDTMGLRKSDTWPNSQNQTPNQIRQTPVHFFLAVAYHLRSATYINQENPRRV